MTDLEKTINLCKELGIEYEIEKTWCTMMYFGASKWSEDPCTLLFFDLNGKINHEP